MLFKTSPLAQHKRKKRKRKKERKKEKGTIEEWEKSTKNKKMKLISASILRQLEAIIAN